MVRTFVLSIRPEAQTANLGCYDNRVVGQVLKAALKTTDKICQCLVFICHLRLGSLQLDAFISWHFCIQQTLQLIIVPMHKTGNCFLVTALFIVLLKIKCMYYFWICCHKSILILCVYSHYYVHIGK